MLAERLTMSGAIPETVKTTGLVDIVSGRSYQINTPLCKVGRDSANDVILSGDKSLSRFHFQIQQSGKDFYIEDCRSRNGTLVNGSPLRAPRKLTNGDLISAGMGRYRFAINVPEGTKEIPEDPEATGQFRIEDFVIANSQSTENSSTNIDPESALDRDTTKAQQISSSLEKIKSSLEPTKKPDQPGWSPEIAIPPELEKLKQERNRLEGVLGSIKNELRTMDNRIYLAQTTFNRLLSTNGHELTATAKHVLETLNWHVDWSTANPQELSIKSFSKTEAVLKVVSAADTPPLEEIEDLIQQQASIRSEQGFEPKGLILVQVHYDLPSWLNPEPSSDLGRLLAEKRICLFSTIQLLTIYRHIYLANGNKAELRQTILNNSGILLGFQPSLEAKV